MYIYIYNTYIVEYKKALADVRAASVKKKKWYDDTYIAACGTRTHT
jgi:hypothetical protein